ncbi:DUF4834 family protein [Echinicola vietnamensis]|uniref:DUF4834 domain-containing protein n=1 Tax=Echinicola vietnamensis (strain DSM 17526 / LMG 23754 / KMM 6221) TaxID=926556 RepID=L0FUS9_ECHVK|nr:DUF4834 family protein [Echinicola vietnamensis]AGA77042.1 hypothetical protein Echvi_0767 [Echinicola vietnamensis DSM 17526]
MIKFLLIVLGVGWLLGQLVRYFLRSKLARFAQQVNQAAKEQEQAQRRANDDGDIHVDYVPKSYDERRSKDIKGGEYVDYEEVKD